MSELAALQCDFAAALRDARADGAMARWLAGDVSSIARRLAIYRANVSASAGKALGAAYPVIRQVVGDECFDAWVRAYRRQTPSSSGNLDDYGDDFASLLRASPSAASLPYLPDLARMEWAVHRAYGAADSARFDAASLASVGPEQQGGLSFLLAPGTVIADSIHPVARIWAIHQAGFDDEFAVDWTVRETALVSRDALRVTVTAIDATQAAFWRATLDGLPLALAVAAAADIDPDFDFGALLVQAMASNLICGFTLDKEAS